MFHYHYRPQRSCEGYVFTGVCLSTGRVEVSASVHAGIPHPLPPRSRHPPEQTPSRVDPLEQIPPGSRPPPEQTPPGADTPRKQTPPRADTPPGADTPWSRYPPSRYGHCCGRYAFYCSAFLLIICEEVSNKVAKCANQNKWHFGDPEESCSRISSLL